MKAGIILAALLLLELACTAFQGVPDVGDRAPEFNIPDTAWVQHRLSEWGGKVVMLGFWKDG